MPDYTRRAEINDRSRNHADHHTHPWTADELGLLETWDGSEDELIVMAEILGRTVEACRQKFYVNRSGVNTEVTTTTVVAKSVTYTTRTTRAWTVGFCYQCGKFDDLLSTDGRPALCEDCR